MTKTWRERIAEARERGKFTREDVIDSGDWRKCAVGEQHEKFPLIVRYLDGLVPEDDQLTVLGSMWGGFGGAVFHHCPDAADQFLDQIEDRVLELKREYTDGGSTQGGDA